MSLLNTKMSNHLDTTGTVNQRLVYQSKQMNDFNDISKSLRVILCQEVRESCSVYIYIYTFCVAVS